MRRNLAERIEFLLKSFPVVSIIGARQVGKTTLAKQLRPDWEYFDLQQPSHVTRIVSDPEVFFKDYPHSIILDEAQMHPIIFDTLRGVIDANRMQKGRFIITGSSSPDLLKHLSESLAGRIAIVELGTLKANEIAQAPQSDFYQWFKHSLGDLKREDLRKIASPALPREVIEKAWFDGGYPEVVLLENQEEKDNWFDFYEQTYLYRDIASLFPQMNVANFQRFLKILAHLSGTILNKSNLARDLEISEGSIRNYLHIAEGIFLWRSQPSFEKKGYRQLIKMPKGYLKDSGLLHYLLKMPNLNYVKDSPMLGRSFEGFVIEEILKGLEALSLGSWNAYHYRTKHGAEIDLILEGQFGILPIEVKYGIRIDKRQLISLNRFIEEMNLPFGIIINQADRIDWIAPKVLQIPVGYI